MKTEYTDENFEEFLKSSAGDLRMRAPDRVWKNISGELNKRRRRFFIGLTAFLLITSGISYYTLTISAENATSGIVPQTNPQKIPVNKNEIPKATATRETMAVVRNEKQADINPAAASAFRQPVASRQASSAFNYKSPKQTVTPENDLTSLADNFAPTVVDSDPEYQKEAPAQPDRLLSTATGSSLPLTIESVVNTYKPNSRKKKIETQLHFTPTISYRKLTENKSYLRSVSPSTPVNYSSLYSSVNKNVTHKPDLGFELGFTAKYPVAANIKLRAGLQLNVNRYDVKAFSSSLEIATIALNTRSRIDSLNTVSSYSNINGYKANWLQNFSFQASVPVGIELTLPGAEKTRFGIAATIQPTYVLGDKAYLITTDYKNYTQVPWLTRHWNVNTALEAFVTYNTGKTKWQVGPQVRYQLLSSFISQYPVKENLFDFGLKVGLSLNK